MPSNSSSTPDPDDAEQSRKRQEASPENTQPAKPTPPSEPRKEERPQGYGTRPGATRPPLKMTPLSLNLDVHRQGLNPFIIGVLVGAIVALLGVLLGLIMLTLWPWGLLR